ncbi:MAG: Mur ligase family protein [bacterium]
MKKWLHIIGVAGVATSAIALMYRKLGWHVSGSAKGFYPPVSNYLKDHSFEILIGYKAVHLTDAFGNHPDLVLYQGLENPNNLEMLNAKKLKLKLITYPELVAAMIIKSGNSIVVAGTYGKTTITALLVNIFNAAKIENSHLIGAIPVQKISTAKVKTSNTKWSIVEGDEYLVSLTNPNSKFFQYQPTHLILNAIQWDHADLFPTEKNYLENFKKLILQLPANGLLVANANNQNVVTIAKFAKCQVIYYAADKSSCFIKPDWYLLESSRPLPTLIRQTPGIDPEIIPFERNIPGRFNNENILAAAVLSAELGIKKERIQEGIEEFQGIKRRLEIIYQNEHLIVMDDFGSSPPKAAGALKSVKTDYPDAEIIAIFEPNTGNRTPESLHLYKNTFQDADLIILPRFTKLPLTKIKRFDATILQKELLRFHKNVILELNDNELIENLLNQTITKKRKVIIFLGSHSFRGMIDQFVTKLKNEES